MNPSYLVRKVFSSARNFLLFLALIASFMGIGVGGAYLYARAVEVPALQTAEVSLSTTSTSGLGSSTQQLNVNAQLHVNGSFYLAPQALPQKASAGTIVFDKATSTLQYYDGTQFVPVASQNSIPQPVASGVTSLQGQTGAITLTPGPGISINGFAISNSGLLGINGVPGDINVTTANGVASLSLPQAIGPTSSPVFAGLNLSAALTVGNGGTGTNTLAANGVLMGNGTGAITSVPAAGAGLCLISTAGAPAWGLCAGGGGAGVATLDGLMGTLDIANTTGVGTTITIDDASTSAKGIAQFNATNFSVSSGLVNTIQNIATSASPTFNGLTLSTALTVANGGTGLNTLTSNAVLVGNGTGAVQRVSSSGAGDCLVSTSGAPIFTTCPGSGGVASINSQTGAVTVNNATGASGAITIDNASTAAKGIAQFNSTNFSAAAGVVNTIQGIATTASPTFAGLTLSAALTVGNGGTGATSAAGARSNLSAAISGANNDITSTSVLNAITPSAALTVGSSSFSITLQGSNASTFKATSGASTTTLGFATPTANATINLPALSAGTYELCTTSGNCLGGGSGGANTALSNLSSVAINTALLPGSTAIDLGSSAAAFRDLYIGGAVTNNFRLTGTATAARTITLPDATGTVCLTTGNCLGGGGGAAPSSAQYLTLATDSNLSAERVLTAGTNISITDAGANSSLTVDTVANPTFATSVTTPQLTSTGALSINPGGALTMGATTQSFLLQGTQTSTITARNGSNITTIGFASPTASATINFPALTAGTYTICTSSGNCTGASTVDSINTFTGAITVQGTANRITVNNSLGTITLSTPQDINTGASPTFSGLTLTSLTLASDTVSDITGTGLQVVGGALQSTLGLSVDLTSEVTGTLPIANGGTNSTATATQGGVAYGTGTAYAFTAAGSSGQCLVSNGTSAPTFQSCSGTGSGVTLQAAYDNGNTITTTNARNITFTLADTATDSNFLVNIATSSTSKFAVQNNGTDVVGVTSSAITLAANTSVSGSNTLTVGTGATALGGNLTVDGNTTIGNATTDRLTVTAQLLGASPLVFQGGTDNSFTTTFAFTDPTANRTFTFGDDGGLVCTANASASCLSAYQGSGYLVQVPATTAANTITPTVNSVVGLTVNGTSGTAATAVNVLQAGAATGLAVTSSNTGTGVAITSSNTGTGQTISLTNTTGTQTAGLSIDRNGGGGTTTSLVSLSNTAGTATNGILFTGTITNDITSAVARTLTMLTGTTGALTLDTGTTGTVNLGTNANAKTVNIGTGAAVANTINIGGTGGNTIAIGNTQTAGSVAIGAAMTTGTITIGGTGLQTGTINLGTGTGAQAIHLGDGGTGAKTVTLGSTASTGATTIQSGTGNITLQSAGTSAIGTIQIGAGGAGSTTPDFLALDVKSTTGDPAGGAEGYMYYNTFDNKFRCFQGAAWTDCAGTGGSSLFTDAGTQTYLTSTTDELVVGSSSSFGAKLAVMGTSDQAQLLVRANATQTAPIIRVNDSSDAELFSIRATNNSSLFIGFAAGQSNSGNYNTALGTAALQNNTTGFDNVAVGMDALRDNVAGNDNVAVGRGTLGGNTSGDSNVAIGKYAMWSSSDGIGNIALGIGSMGLNTGNYNIALGLNALLNNTDNDNIALGSSALSANVTGSDNIALGRNAMTGADGGIRNIALGISALDINTGNDNLALGNVALSSNTSGNENIALGGGALMDNISGSDSIALGDEALKNNASGDHNIALGDDAMRDSEGGAHNISLGYQSLLVSTGSGNIALGYTAGDNLTSGDNNIIIGYGVDASSASVSNQLRIGSGSTITMQADLSSMAVTFNGSVTVGGNILPSAAGTLNVGSTSAEFGSIYVGDDNGLNLGLDQDAKLAYDETTDDRVELTGTGASLFIEDRLALGVDAQTIANNGNGGTTATLTLNPASSFVRITCNDPQGCDITMSESTGVKDGNIVYITNITAVNVNFADTAGVTELAGAFAAGQYDAIQMIYSSDRWVEVSRANN